MADTISWDTPDALRRLRRLRRLAKLLDAQWRLPGTNFRFGIDSLAGLVPGLGDLITTVVSLYVIHEAGKLGASRWTQLGMLLRVIVDLLLGSVPVVGDAFDFVYKANQQNLRAIGVELDDDARRGGGAGRPESR